MSHSEEAITAGLMAVIAHPTYTDAEAALKAQGYSVTAATLSKWVREDHVVEYEKLREKWAPQLEARLANNFLDNARRATEVEREAIEKSMLMLQSGRAQDPAKMARDLSQVKTQSIDKRLALQGRPTQITERRDLGQIVARLQQLGAVKVIEASAEEVTDG